VGSGRRTPTDAAARQSAPGEGAAVVAEGFKVRINNRPDVEIPADLQCDVMRAAAEAAGLTYVTNPVMNGGMTMDMVVSQGAAVAKAEGPILAYCRSGTRSTIIWALSQAGTIPTEEMVNAAAEAGYDLAPMAGQINALAADKG